MAKINIEITASLAQLSSYADGLGYQADVSKTPEELALLTEPISIQDRLKENPESKQDFLLSYFKKVVVEELSKQQVANIQKEIDDAKEVQKVTVKNTIDSAVTVSLT